MNTENFNKACDINRRIYNINQELENLNNVSSIVCNSYDTVTIGVRSIFTSDTVYLKVPVDFMGNLVQDYRKYLEKELVAKKTEFDEL